MRLASAKGRKNQAKRWLAAFTLKEAIIIIVVLVILAGMLLPALCKARRRSSRLSCALCLKNVGVAFRVFASDNNGLFPMEFSTNSGGTMEFINTGEVFRHFQVMSNELATPRILVCPVDDPEERKAASRFDTGFANENLSYFVGLDASDVNPSSILSGDRNVDGGNYVGNHVFSYTSKQASCWGTNIHGGWGHLLKADGSVGSVSSSKLAQAFQKSGHLTNRLAIPP